MEKLLELQKLDLQVEALSDRERMIPQQKNKYQIQRERLAAELKDSEQRCKNLQLEQRQCEHDIEQRQAQTRKYDGQLLSIKKNEEYQALLHEIELEKKQIALKEERIIGIMLELDDAKAHLEEDRKRIAVELKQIESECDEIDKEYQEAVEQREALEAQRGALLPEVSQELRSKYDRIRKAKKKGPAVVPLSDEYCGGCHMKVLPQVVNEILAASKTHACSHCGRLLYNPEKFTVPV
ncbi:MAG: hypothetical protein HYV26_14550 [Candidatus Hydrogenedentes bacterium]|nr:hypothetical protein [Candidatus Hydrogenedentota bacterium]MBI3119958.1 hypothetical protein [Candidatus Hydrogenedentota bacterium]